MAPTKGGSTSGRRSSPPRIALPGNVKRAATSASGTAIMVAMAVVMVAISVAFTRPRRVAGSSKTEIRCRSVKPPSSVRKAPPTMSAIG